MLEKFLQEELTAELKKLTRTEGQYISKLILEKQAQLHFHLLEN